MTGFQGIATPLDPRLLQIAVLIAFVAIQLATSDFGTNPGQVAITIIAAQATQAGFDLRRGVTPDWRSPLISALSLSLLLRSHNPLVWAAAGCLAIGSKFLVRFGGKHLFNPSCFAIVVLLFAGQAWVSPGIWGATWLFGGLVISFASMVLSRSDRIDIALAFLLGYAGLLLARCANLGDPLSIPLHQMQSGTLLLFGCFMITDPRSTPDSRFGRVLFAIVVAALGYTLQFTWQMREGLFYALVLAAPLVPLFDRCIPSPQFRWTNPREA